MVPMPKNLNKFSKEGIQTFLNSFDTVLSDCDGVLWLKDQVIEGSQHVVNKFVDMKKSMFYVTNNNSKTREEFAEKCIKLGFLADKNMVIRTLILKSSAEFCEVVSAELLVGDNVSCCYVLEHGYKNSDLEIIWRILENIICTSYLAAEYLKSLNFNKKVYVLGCEGITKELDKVGIRHTDIGPDVLDSNLDTYIKTKLKLDPEIGAVLQGFDQHFSYPKLVKAATYLKNPNVHFLATCPDESFPADSELVFPGTGCFVKSLEAVSGRKAFILGKPNDYIKEAILRRQKLNPARTLMIGDRCNTDILFGRRCGFQTLLVLTGVTSLEDVEKFSNSTDPSENDLVPHYYIDKLGDLLPYM